MKTIDIHEPSFNVGNDILLSGNEIEFFEMKSFAAQHLADIGAQIKVECYTVNEKWGHIYRIVYVSTQPKSDLRGTLMLWKTHGSEKFSISSSVPAVELDWGLT